MPQPRLKVEATIPHQHSDRKCSLSLFPRLIVLELKFCKETCVSGLSKIRPYLKVSFRILSILTVCMFFFFLIPAVLGL